MTIEVEVTNKDSRETAIVSVKTVNQGVNSLFPLINFPPIAKLKGGESTKLYVHNGQSVVIEEVQNG